MIFQKELHLFGKYVRLMARVFSVPNRWSEFFRRYIAELYKLGVDSIPIVVTISIFMGAVFTLQVAINISSPLIPAYTIGMSSRDTFLLEFSSAIMCLILAGKVGSNIASEIGTMRVTEQIDALDVMGVNSANYLIFPKIMAMVTFIPILVTLSMFTGLLGGFFVSLFTSTITVSKFIYGIQSYFVEFYIWYAMIKSLVFAFIISSVASFFGYYARGGALDVGKGSTNAVVVSSVMILFFDVLLTKLMLQ